MSFIFFLFFPLVNGKYGVLFCIVTLKRYCLLWMQSISFDNGYVNIFQQHSLPLCIFYLLSISNHIYKVMLPSKFMQPWKKLYCLTSLSIKQYEDTLYIHICFSNSWRSQWWIFYSLLYMIVCFYIAIPIYHFSQQCLWFSLNQVLISLWCICVQWCYAAIT